jgi:hypothetical protein
VLEIFGPVRCRTILPTETFMEALDRAVATSHDPPDVERETFAEAPDRECPPRVADRVSPIVSRSRDMDSPTWDCVGRFAPVGPIPIHGRNQIRSHGCRRSEYDGAPDRAKAMSDLLRPDLGQTFFFVVRSIFLDGHPAFERRAAANPPRSSSTTRCARPVRSSSSRSWFLDDDREIVAQHAAQSARNSRARSDTRHRDSCRKEPCHAA